MSCGNGAGSFRARALIFALICLFPAANRAQTYPVKPVRYVVPFPAGGSPDIIARLLTERLGRMWGQQLLVDNRPGAGGTVGAAFAAKSPADGYTLFQCNSASSAIAPRPDGSTASGLMSISVISGRAIIAAATRSTMSASASTSTAGRPRTPRSMAEPLS